MIDSPVSREGAFLANNVLFAVFAFVVLLGTVFPLIVEALRDEQLSVGAPFFERMLLPIGLALLTLMAIAPVLPWRKASGELLRHRLLWPAVLGVASLVLAALLGARGVGSLLAFGLGGFAAGSALRQLVLATRRQGWRGLVGRANGGMVVHLGVIMIAVAIAASSGYSRRGEFRVTRRPDRRRSEVTPSSSSGCATWSTRRSSPARPTSASTGARCSRRPGSASTTRASSWARPRCKTGLTGDIYLSLPGRPSDDPAAPVSFSVLLSPLTLWLWIGGAVMAVGTALAMFPGRRRRRPTDPVSAPVAEPTADATEPQVLTAAHRRVGAVAPHGR